MTTRQYLETLVVCDKIKVETLERMNDIIDTDVDIKDFCTKMLKLYKDKEGKFEILLATFKNLILGLSADGVDKQKLVNEFINITEAHVKYVGEMQLPNIASVFSNDIRNYQICKNDLRFLRVVDTRNTTYKLNGKKRKFGYVVTTDMINDLTINGRSYGYKAIFIKDGKEEKVKAMNLNDCNKIIYRLIRDDYDIALLPIMTSKFSIMNNLDLSELTDEEFMELLKILNFWDFDSGNVDSDKYFKLSEGNVGIKYILKEMVQAHMDINTILDFCFELKEKLKKIKRHQRMTYIQEIEEIMNFRNENIAFRYIDKTYEKLSEEIRKCKDIKKVIEKLKIGIVDEIRNINVDGKDIYFNEKSCMIANRNADNELAFSGLLVVDKDKQAYLVRTREEKDKIDKGDYLFRISFNFKN